IASIPVLHAAGALSFPLLLVLVALVGCFNAPYFAAQRVVLPAIVGENEQAVGQANALVEGGSRLAALVGPSTAGLPIVGAGATSAGAILGVIVAMRLIVRVAPFTLATVAFVGGVLPLWALTVKAPVAVLVLALAIFGASTPLINAPVLGALTMRTPEALRP